MEELIQREAEVAIDGEVTVRAVAVAVARRARNSQHDSHASTTVAVLSPQTFVAAFERAAYTTAVTFKRRTALIKLAHHLHRLESSYITLRRDLEERECIDEQASPPPAARALCRAIEVALSLLSKLESSQSGVRHESEALVVMCIPVRAATTLDPQIHVWVRANQPVLPDLAPQRGPAHCALTVELCVRQRRLAHAKDSSWVRDRRDLEEQRDPRAMESILCAQEHGDLFLLEGTVHNIFVLRADGSLQTAGDHILLGHVRALVLQAAEHLGITVVHSSPRFSERSSWAAAMLTNAVRVFEPVAHILVPSSALPGSLAALEIDLDPDPPLAHRMRQRIAEILHSDPTNDLSSTTALRAPPTAQ
uniref:Uncharacterized protein n=1 Tax=Erythrolobus australicus TaxID=1077150 RepID=A0A7S1TN53_9RHOD|mmetsp:Transcript_411/g.1077  ORF Transcript_411/g.1077 Transcript_411/m.1077 type:complete len:364 (+) Transcript_411:712-1803(+)